MNKAYEELMKEYEDFIAITPHYKEFQKEIAKAVKNHFKDRQIDIIDLGTGFGHTVKALIKEGINCNIKSIDNSEVMLNSARKYLGQAKKIELIQNDVLDYLYKLPRESVDSVVSGKLLHTFFPEKRYNIFNQIYRVLKKNGIFVNGDKIAVDNIKEHNELLDERINKINCFLNNPLKDNWISHYKEDDKIRYSESEYDNILNKLGFESIKICYRKEMEAVISALK